MPVKNLYNLLRESGESYMPSDSHIADITVCDIAYNSQNAGNGILFICVKGATSDGHDYAADAYTNGSRVFVVERKLDLPANAIQILVEDSRKALSDLSASFFGHPERQLRLIGITGTKGKSTVCEMIAHILNENGYPAGTIGTVGARYGDMVKPTRNTTPESYELYKLFSEMAEAKIRYVVMEVSSQGIKCGRVRGMSFFAAVMTNLSPDHIGGKEHPDFADYKACKKELFRHADNAFFNADDSSFPEFMQDAIGTVRTYALDKPADLYATDIRPCRHGDDYGVLYTVYDTTTSAAGYLPMPGRISVYNALAACQVCLLLGVPLENTVKALGDMSVPGRFETVHTLLPDVSFVIDYAHNGESLRLALAAMKEYQPKRLVCLFGAVGERTKLRRREMGIAASAYADFCILTDDNPGSEPSLDIIREIEAVLTCPHISIPNREEAVRYAAFHAEQGDLVLLAGKGHETYQYIDGKRIPLCEREIIMSAVEERLHTASLPSK